MSYNGKITLIRSQNLQAWEIAAEIKLESADLRDPRLIVFDGQLLMYCGVRQHDIDPQSVLFISKDGSNFHQENINGLEGYWLWCIIKHDGILYGSGYRMSDGEYQVKLYTSSNGIIWQKQLDLPAGNETSLDFSGDGTLYALIRDDCHGSCPKIAIIDSPYTAIRSWETLPVRLQGPMIKRMNNGCVIIGRRWDSPGRFNVRTDVLWLEDEHEIKFIRTLPSGGDCSYAAWVDNIDDHSAVIAYYSAHEHKIDGINENNIINDPAAAEHSTQADIYLAEVYH